MLNDTKDPLLDMEDDDIGGPVSQEAAHEAQMETNEKYGRNKPTFKVPDAPMIAESCPKCGGDGRYKAPSSLGHQICLKCKGKGVLYFKKPRAERDAAKIKARERKEKKLDAQLVDFEAQHPDLAAWWTGSDFGFAIDLRSKARQYGSLTYGQIEAAKRCIEKYEAAKAAKAAAQVAVAEHVAALPVLDVSHVTNAFERARNAGIKRPKLRLFSSSRPFVFSRAPDAGKNAGAIYVKAEDGLYLGKVTGGKFFKSYDCSTDAETEVIKVCSDPAQAAVAYGKKFGLCSVCGRELSDPVSIERGIGPICADRMFG